MATRAKAKAKASSHSRYDSELGPTFLLCGVDGIAPRSGSELLIDTRSDVDWETLRGRNVRIIDDNKERIAVILRAACALDCHIDVLDTGDISYAMIFYDTSPHRRMKEKAGLPVLPPAASSMSPFYALWLIKGYTNASSQPR